MTNIEAIVRPSALEAVMKALDHVWIQGLTVTEVKGYGLQNGHTGIYRGAEFAVEMTPRLKVQVVVPDPLVQKVLHDLERALRTGKIGDGKIFATRIDEAIRVRTGERGEGAL